MGKIHFGSNFCVVLLWLQLAYQQNLYNSSEVSVSTVPDPPFTLNSSTALPASAQVQAADPPLNCDQKFSCRSRCSNESSKWEDFSRDAEHCHCDRACLKYQDCCADFEHYCAPLPVTKGDSRGPGYSCADISTYQEKGVFMISTCAADWKDEGDSFIKCMEASKNSNRSFTSENIKEDIPVYDFFSENNYRNLYCVTCNKKLLPPNFWQLKFRCNIQAPSHYSTKQKLDFYLKYCRDKSVEPGKHSRVRTCLPMVSTCSIDNKHKEGCMKGNSGLVHSKKTKKNFKNIDCLLCNGESLEDVTCGPQEKGDIFNPKSFEIVMHFITGETPEPELKSFSTSCSENKVFDPHLETCEDTYVRNPSLAVRDTYRIKQWMYPTDNIERPMLQQEFIDGFCSRFALKPSQIYVISNSSEKGIIVMEFNLYAGQAARGIDDNETLDLAALLNFNESFPIIIANKTWLVIRVTQRQLSCANPEEYFHDEYRIKPTGEALLNRTGDNLQESLPPKKFFIKRNDNGSDSLIVCRSTFSVLCPFKLLLVSSSEFKVLANKSLLHTTTGRVYLTEEYTLMDEVKKAWICANHTKIRRTETSAGTTSRENTFLRYFTIAGFSISVFALFLTLTMHSVFIELRGPLPGKNLMSLCFALLLAQFMWLFGSGDTDKPTFCTIMAVVIHYLILASFGCTAVIAFDTRRTFSSKISKAQSRSIGKSRNLRLLAYTCLAWGIPLLFVAGCVLLDHFQVVFIGYGNEVACWIVSSNGKIVTLATPIACVLLYNFGAFTHTVWAIKSAKKQTHRVKSSRQDQGAVFKIYIRLASLMGFTWFFSFSAEFIHEALLYPFVMLTTTQGVYIFVAFICKARVLKLLKERFPRSRKDAMASTQHTASTECKSLPAYSPKQSARDTRF
ncbi:uncharacterized protein LOC111319273 [Stylophora pistillata]|uniref:uncharacterized protein LOC111319273 n=1 Tax=Stylophora pistillata TaxID=50429 RepID=UPI000C04C715|nr:uncharacterized protein LOC111319273 [Stylophora pistillata]